MLHSRMATSIAKKKSNLVLLFYIAIARSYHLYIFFDLHVLRLTCIDINMYIIYL